MRFLIISDGRAGHLNQSIAFTKHLNADYEILPIRFTCKAYKLLSYLFDALHYYTPSLYAYDEKPQHSHYDAIIGAGSTTYYAVKTFAKAFRCASITMMLPKGYRYDFTTIFAQAHDRPPQKKNIITLPANFSFTEPQGFFVPSKKAVGIIIGGNNTHFTMDTHRVKHYLDFIFTHFIGYEIAVTTSPRTPKEVETLLKSYAFDYSVIFSENKINPIADFLKHCEVVFITIDSTSMISEAISYGTSSIEVLPLNDAQNNKFHTMSKTLEKEGYLHIFDGEVAHHAKKIDFKAYAHKALV